MTKKAELYAKFNASHAPQHSPKLADAKGFYEREVVIAQIKTSLAELLKDSANQQSEVFNTPKDFEHLISEAIKATSPPARQNKKDDIYKDFENPFGLEQLNGFRTALNEGRSHNPRRIIGIQILLKATNAAQEALWSPPKIGFGPKPDVWQR